MFPIKGITIDLDVDPFPPSQQSEAAAPTRQITIDQAALLTGLQYGPGKGYPPLLARIKQLNESLFHPPGNTDVTLTVGSTDAIYKVVSLITDPGDTVLVEKYGYPGMNPSEHLYPMTHLCTSVIGMILTAPPLGRGLRSVDMDDNGIIPDSLEAVIEACKSEGTTPKLLYVVPTGQNPTGISYSPERMSEVYKVCEKHGVFILEVGHSLPWLCVFSTLS